MSVDHNTAEWHCPKIEINGMMRRAFADRIIGFKSVLARKLRPYLLVASVPVTLSLLASSQTGLSDFANGSPPDPKELDENSNKDSGERRFDDDDDDGGDPPEDGGAGDEEEVEKCVIIYVRVSSNEQKEDGHSIESQIDELTSIVESNPAVRNYTPEPIRDEGKTGTNFDRPGIKRVAELAQSDEVTHLMVDTIDRIGRNIAETLLFIKYLREECGVKLLTRTKEYDIVKPVDKMQVSMLAMMADFGTMNRARSAHRSKADNFLKEKSWRSWYRDYVPVGYELVNSDDDESWIQKVEELEEVIDFIYEEFLKVRSYAKVRDTVNERFRDRLRQYENIEGDELTRHQVKRILSRPVYRGEPTIPVTTLEHYDPHPSVKDPELALVSEQRFEAVQEVIGEIRAKYSSDDAVTYSPAEYASEFNPFTVESASPLVELRCPKCHEKLIANGQLQYDGEHASRWYECSNEECDFNQRWPNQSERNLMRMLGNIENYRDIF